MKDGFIKVAAATPEIKVGDCPYNGDSIINCIHAANEQKVKLLVLPELCITGYTCNDLFLQDTLLQEAKAQLMRIVEESKQFDMGIVVGLPMQVKGKLYNCGAVIHSGKLLGIVPKKYLPNYAEFYEARHFAKGMETVTMLQVGEEMVPFGMNLLFQCENIPNFIFACELCEDLWVPNPPSVSHALAGATIICNLSASVETTVKDHYRKGLVNGQSARLLCGYIYADAGEGESTTDVVFSGHNLISENGTTLAESTRFQNEMIISEIDVNRLVFERRKMTTFEADYETNYHSVFFTVEESETTLTRTFAKTPFIPSSKSDKEKRCEEITMLQVMGLKKRLDHTKAKSAVIGLSGGLDSTLALLVTIKAFDLAKKDRKDIICITMPCFGTTDRTYQNALALAKGLGTTLREINIEKAVTQHFSDIGHDSKVHDVTYENSQARQRTLILMNVANQNGGLVICTGDMSELALGWATYNGDHMSMYGVNVSVPKTLVRHLVQYYADTCENTLVKNALLDVLDTPVSPELLPPEKGEISQKTEDLVGPYELHDFFLYYMLRWGFSPKKIFRLACDTFTDCYSKEIVLKWMKTFYRRFFSQQFKRSCLPDGPKVGSVSISPRGDLRMPSDASSYIWLQELESITL